jgi:hypothetical protein
MVVIIVVVITTAVAAVAAASWMPWLKFVRVGHWPKEEDSDNLRGEPVRGEEFGPEISFEKGPPL